MCQSEEEEEGRAGKRGKSVMLETQEEVRTPPTARNPHRSQHRAGGSNLSSAAGHAVTKVVLVKATIILF